MDAKSKRTKYILYEYYHPQGLKMPSYYSKQYQKSYTDGYGYNFYYGSYGYYEYSKLPLKPTLDFQGDDIPLFVLTGILVASFCVCCILMALVSHYKCFESAAGVDQV